VLKLHDFEISIRNFKRSVKLVGENNVMNKREYYVYAIKVDGVIRYIGKGKGRRVYAHMAEVRKRLNRDFKLGNIFCPFQRKLTKAVMDGAEVVEEILVKGLGNKAV
jgi:hypothetical protein